jgi:DNA-binding transcriptional LysR family regulator
VNLNLVEGLYPTVEASLLDGSMDFYVGPEADPATAAGLVQTILADNDRIVLARKGHPLQKARSLAELKDAEWASTFVTLSARDELDTLFARYRLGKPRLALRAESALSLMVAIGYSDLLAMVPVQWTQFEMMSGVLQPIQVREKLPAPRLAFVRRAALPLTPAAEHFAELLIGSLKKDAVSTTARAPRRRKARGA